MGFFDKFRHNKEQREAPITPLPEEPSALGCILNGFRLDDFSSTSLSAFFAAMELISNSVAQLPIKVKRFGEQDLNHPLNFLFKNTLISKFTFIKQMICDIILKGNAFAYIERAADGTPVNLVYCEPSSVNIFYQQNKQELYYTIPFCRKGKIEPIDVIHLYKNSNDGVRGRSLVSYANAVLQLSKATDKAASKYYSSGCALQGALTIKGSRKNSKEQARQAFSETHNGQNGSGLVILDDDMTYTPLSSNANDSQMIESRTFNVAEIARYFNINPILLGDNSGSSYSSIEAANIEFVSHTLMPYISLVEDEFNRKLIKPSENGLTIDLDETVLMRGDKATTASYLKTLTDSAIISVNEARKMLGLAPIEGGDKHRIAYSDANQNEIEK